MREYVTAGRFVGQRRRRYVGQGLALGGTLENAVVVDGRGAQPGRVTP